MKLTEIWLLEVPYYLTGSFVDKVTTNGLNQIWSDLISFSWVKNEDGINRESLMTFMEIDDHRLIKKINRQVFNGTYKRQSVLSKE